MTANTTTDLRQTMDDQGYVVLGGFVEPAVPPRVEDGCMQFITDTHKLGVVPYESREHYLEITDRELKRRLDQAVDIETDPGDVVLFSRWIIGAAMRILKMMGARGSPGGCGNFAPWGRRYSANPVRVALRDRRPDLRSGVETDDGVVRQSAERSPSC